MEEVNPNSLKNISLSKWILRLIGGVFLFFLLYAFAQLTSELSCNVILKSLIMIVVAIALLAMYIGVVRQFEERKIKELKLTHAASGIVKGFLMGACYMTVVVLTMMAFGYYKIESIQFDTAGILLSLSFFLIVGVGEELIFRGIIFRFIDTRWNYVVALIISALLFGFVHITNQNATVWSSVAIAIEAGLMLGAAYMYSGTLWFPIGIHWAWNFFEGNVFGTAVSGNEESTSVITSSIDGPELLTGGSFGPEASIIALILGLVLSVWLIYKAKTKE